MIGLSRLNRAIEDMPKGGMQTGDPKVTIKLCDAQRIKAEIEGLQRQNAELLAQVEVLTHRITDLTNANALSGKCLRQIQADAVEAFWFAGASTMTKDEAKAYAAKVRQGGE